MKKLIYLTVLFLAVSNALDAQFDAGKYFADSVSFSFERCFTSTSKKKETICGTEKCVAKFYTDFIKIFAISVFPASKTNTDMVDYDEVKLGSIDFYQSDIKKSMQYSTNTKPAVIYELQLRAKSMKDFTHYSRIFGKSSTTGATLYFSSYEDARDVKEYLKLRNQIINGDGMDKKPSVKADEAMVENILSMLGKIPGECVPDIKAKGFTVLTKEGDFSMYCTDNNMKCISLYYKSEAQPLAIIGYATMDRSFLTNIQAYWGIELKDDPDHVFDQIWENATHTRRVMIKTKKNDHGEFQYMFDFKVIKG